MSVDSEYYESVLAVGETNIYVFDRAFDGGILKANIKNICDISVKRMYGNACISAKIDGEHKKRLLFRYSYTVSALCDAAALFIENVQKGNNVHDEYDAVKASYEKKLAVCPKCGRTLLHPGADCIQCQPKTKVASKLLKYVVPQKKILIISMLMSILTTSLALLPPFLTKLLVDDVLVAGNENSKNQLTMIVLVLLFSYIVIQVVNGIRGYMLRMAGNRIVQNLRNDVYEKAQHLPMSFYDRTSTGAVINRISGDSSTLQSFMLRISQEVVVQFFLLIGIIIIMLAMDWRLALLALIPIPFVVVGAKKFGKKISPYYRRIWRKWAAVSSILTDTIPCIRVIKSFAGEKRAVNKFDKYNEEWYKVDTQSAKITNTFPAIVSFVVSCGSLLIWSVGGNWVLDGNYGVKLGMLVSFFSFNFFAYLSDSYQSALAAAERILDIIDAEPEPDFGKGLKPEKILGKIEFKNVNFSFDKTKKTLNNINIIIEPGDVIGIVGTTGSGKSTLINLLMRFYDNYEGEILLDGTNIKDIDMEYYRSIIGFVQQEPMMFSDTIYSNIAYGVPDAHVEAVINAADIANAHEFIANQPDGYDSMLGERGVGLSGGEKQRLSIARAVLKNPSILVFDEATASVDSETENLIQEAIERLISGRTTLMIAHRLSTLRKANRILVVDSGNIIENGTHDELMALKG
ncbi:MAG: ABC transporter ATP-binding protein, partial [Clostridia bacterium]